MLWTGRPLIGDDPSGVVLLVYPAIITLPYLAEPIPGDPLGPLLGRTRAAVLERTVRGCTTTDLTAEPGIGLASASEYAACCAARG